MPIKMLKNENAQELFIKMVLHAKNYSLKLDKKKCTGCGICMEICPTEAIQVTRTPKTKGEKAKKPKLEINEQKCHYCGICEAICPFGALDLKIDGKPVVPVIKTESFPHLIRDIRINETKCGAECLEIKDACPLNKIKVSAYTPDEKEDVQKTSRSKKKSPKIKIEIDKEACPCCRFCETKFPEGTIHVGKMFFGSLRINNEKCPENCHDCADVCPILDVLYIQNGRVKVNDSHCVYCGACKITCPEEGALELNRTRILHSEVRSAAWNRALEKLASTNALTKEIRNKNSEKLKKVVINRVSPEELK